MRREGRCEGGERREGVRRGGEGSGGEMCELRVEGTELQYSDEEQILLSNKAQLCTRTV